MKRLLQLGFLLGLAGTLAAAYFTPWFEYTRYRSATSVVANGGRVEQFLVHLPADRIGPARDIEASSADDAPGPARLEHFKLRDADGNVIGMAVRHALALDGGEQTAWLLTIPSRGTVALAGTAAPARSIEAMLTAQGVAAGQTLERALSIDGAAPAASVAVTGEFEGIEIELVETWVVTGIGADGQIYGTLSLNTLARRPS